ncbi:integrase core domain-containing protein [Microbacterium immunditiarum]|uniref:integrase core domain-containing protein n=1 Tax=Microbacterium immunditiarum TaxID=337480 RepID=UPI0031B5FE3F
MKSPGQNGSRERGFGTLKYERLFLDRIPDALTLIERAEDYRVEYNTERPDEAIAWNRPMEVHLGMADPTIPTFERRRNSANYLTRDTCPRPRAHHPHRHRPTRHRLSSVREVVLPRPPLPLRVGGRALLSAGSIGVRERRWDRRPARGFRER